MLKKRFGFDEFFFAFQGAIHCDAANVGNFAVATFVNCVFDKIFRTKERGVFTGFQNQLVVNTDNFQVFAFCFVGHRMDTGYLLT